MHKIEEAVIGEGERQMDRGIECVSLPQETME